jgi:hypothetical protein
MTTGAFGPGDDVEAWCTRCRMNLEHRVIAVAHGSVQRVHCLTCGGDHKYYPPKTASSQEKKESEVSSAGPTARDRRKPDRTAARAESEWSTFMKEMATGATPRPYGASQSYSRGEFIEHATFGIGRVVDIAGVEKVEVIFKEGRKILICNRKKSG